MYLKKLLSNKILKIIIFIFSLFIILHVFFYFFHASDIIFTSTDISVSKNPIGIGETFEITATIGAASSESTESTAFTIYINNPNIIFPSFTNGSYSVTMPSGEIITYYLEKTENGTIIRTNEIKNGDTILLKIVAKFDKNTTRNNETALISLKYGDTELNNTSISAKEEFLWTDEKTGPSVISVEDNGVKKISGVYSYNIKEIPNLNKEIAAITAKNVHIKDTFIMPAGMNILDVTNQENIIKALGILSLVDKNLKISVNGQEIITEWDETNISAAIEYSFVLDNSMFYLDDNFLESSILKNKLQTTIKNTFDEENFLQEKIVETTFLINTNTDPIKDFQKNIINTASTTLYENGSGYAQEGDVILYEISFENNLNIPQSLNITDIIPPQLEIVNKNDLQLYSFRKDNSFYNDSAGSSHPFLLTIDGKNVIWNMQNILPGEKVKCYIYCKVIGNTSVNIINKAKINEKETSSTIWQNEKNLNINFLKSSNYSGIEPGKEFSYYIKVNNNNDEIISNGKITDTLPDSVEYISSYIKSCGPNSKSGTIETIGNNFSVKDISLNNYEYIEYEIKVRIKDTFIGTNFKNTANYYIDNTLIKTSASENKKEIDNIVFSKESSSYTLFQGEEFFYSLKLYNNSTSNIDASVNNLIIKDKIPDNMIIQRIYYKKSSSNTEFTDNIISSSNDVQLSYNKTLNAHETLTLFIVCKVGDNIIDGQTISNTAYYSNKSASVDVIVVKDNNKLEILKEAFHANGSPVINGEIEKNEIIKFRVKIENKSNTIPVNSLKIEDIITGDLCHYEATSGKLAFTVIDSKNTAGFINNGELLFLNNMWTKDIKWNGFSFLITSNPNFQNNNDILYYNNSFSLNPNGYIILEYSLKAEESFTLGKNKVILNNKYQAETQTLTTLKIPVIDINKTTSINNYTLSELNGLEFYYTIRISNKTSGEAFFSKFTIEDTLPYGIEFCEKWWGNPEPWTQISYSGGSVWLEGKGGHYYVHKDGQKLFVEFGSVDDSGNSNLLNFKSGEYIDIKIKCKFSQAKINELNSINSENLYPIATFDNISKVISSKEFRDIDGNFVTELTDDEIINIVPKTIHPGINKEFFGSFTGKFDNTLNSNVFAGDNIIWTIKISNDNINGSCNILSNFKVIDIFPDNYGYDFTNKSSFKNQMFIVNQNNVQTEIPYIEPTINEAGQLEWNCNNISLQKGEYLFIKFVLINDGTNKYVTQMNTARLKTSEKIIKDTVISGEYIDEYTLEDTSSIIVSMYRTSSYKSINYTPCGNHRYDPIESTTYGYLKTPANKINGQQGERVKYQLYLKNESSINLKDIFFIDRLPYKNDIGVVSNYNRNSSFDVSYDGFISAIIYDKNNIEKKDISGSVVIEFSDNKTDVFKDNSLDWLGQNDVDNWNAEYSPSDSNIRFSIKDNMLEPNDYIIISFYGMVPSSVSETGENNVAWNNFAYSYRTADAANILMIAEPAKVGVWVTDNRNSGKIQINKNLNTNEMIEKTFYFAIFKKINNSFERVSSVQNELIKSNETKSIIFENIPFSDELYYAFETDINGNILNSTSNMIIDGQGQEVLVVENNQLKEVNITNKYFNKKTSLKIIKTAIDDKTNLLKDASFELAINNNIYKGITNEKGELTFSNLEYGIYTLIETKAPSGFQLLNKEIIIDINESTVNDNNEMVVNIDNIKKINMPSTGSIGNLIFVVIGLFITISSIIFYFKIKNGC